MARCCSLTLHTLTGFALRGEFFQPSSYFSFIQHPQHKKPHAQHLMDGADMELFAFCGELILPLSESDTHTDAG